MLMKRLSIVSGKVLKNFLGVKNGLAGWSSKDFSDLFQHLCKAFRT